MPQTTWEKTSLPWSVVPKKWWIDGPWRESKSENALGSWVAMSGAKTPISTIVKRMIRPPQDFGFDRSIRAQDGSPKRRFPDLGVGTPSGASSSAATAGSRRSGIGWIWDTGLR